MISAAVTRNALVLGGFAAVAALALGWVHEITGERIACNRQAALEQRLEQVLPPAVSAAALRDVAVLKDSPLGPGEHRVFRMADEDEHLLMEVTAPEGYGGPIELLVAVNLAGEISGVRVIPPHRETPGLGDRIELRRSDWIRSFEGRSLENTETQQWAVAPDGGDFDAFTGATITPRAVTAAVHRALRFHDQHREQLLTLPGESAFREDCHE